MFQKLAKKIRKSAFLPKFSAMRAERRVRQEHSCLAWKEGDWWFCRTTTAAARQMALKGAIVRVGRAAEIRASPWRRIPGAL